MRTVWKYELTPSEREVTVRLVRMPAGAQLLHVAGQEVTEVSAQRLRHGVYPMLWALVDRDAPLAGRRVALVGTGAAAPDEGQGVYVGTAVCGPRVWHVFDGGEAAAGDGEAPR